LSQRNYKIGFDDPASTWMPSPPHTKACCDLDLQNLLKSSVGSSGHSL